MRTKLTLPVLLVLGLAARFGHAQADTLVTYRDALDRPLPDSTGARYLVKSVRTDELGGEEWVYTHSDGLPHEHARFADLARRIRHGVQQDYYPHSRQVRASTTYNHGRLDGELLSYYPGGQLKRREQFRDYKSQGGESFSETGAPIAFTPYLVMPEFRGGIPQLIEYLQHQMHYPRAERRAGREGRVLVRFVVEKDGQIGDPAIVQPVSPLLDAEALRVVSAMPAWKPGLVDGQVSRVSFTLPVVFKLQ